MPQRGLERRERGWIAVIDVNVSEQGNQTAEGLLVVDPADVLGNAVADPRAEAL